MSEPAPLADGADPAAPMSFPTRVRKFLGRVRRSVELDTYDVYGRAVGPEHETFEDPPGYRFAWGTADDARRFEEFHTEMDDVERDLGIARLGLGHGVVVGFSGDTAVFTMWMNPRNLNVPGEVKRQLGPHQAFIYKAYTSPDHRGRGLYKVGMRFVLHHLFREGKKELIGYAHVKKDVSRKGLATLEFGTKGRYYSLVARGRRITWVSRELARSFPVEVPRSGVLPR